MTTSVSDIPSVSRSSIESCTSVSDMPAVSRSSIEATTSPTIIPSSDEDETDPPLKKQRGQYQTYSLQFKQIVVNELHQVGAEIGEVGERFHLPRSTLFGWNKQVSNKNKNVPCHLKGRHLRSGSGRCLSYPKQVDKDILEWILIRRDSQLPVGMDMIKAKARAVITPHNSNFIASNGWVQKFMARNGLSLRCKTSITQKLPAQLENKIDNIILYTRLTLILMKNI